MTDERKAFEAWATDYFGANVSYPEACFDAWQAALRAQPAEPLVFGMRGPKMTFTIGNQSFTLDYEPETTDEYVFMGNMLKAAISKLPRGVKIGAQPDHSELVKQEREACAVVCDGFAESSQYQTQRKLAMWCASEIRKRGKAIGETME